ncbi:hypothetical protein GCM10023149_48300 [Mucilaginibacter gynuensis]|uniref:PPM-type phosphatase domain-containing protein n=1 Tax=Mucilaginibacter gynuensis TaxID=1302236 RepID=A0ABP8HER9_9SPHI
MQHNEANSGEDDLIRLLLKRQSELNSLLEITRAINKNTATPVLIQMFEVICQNYLHMGKLRFLIEDEGVFVCISKYGGQTEPTYELYKACLLLKKFREAIPVSGHKNGILSQYDYYIPIYQKNKPVAFALIGDFKSPEEMVSNDLNFMQTLINVILVALENRKLFKQQLQSERFQREMELASDVQNMLIPVRMHKDEHIEIDARYLPHQNIGGDYFDFIRINDHEYIWCIADVSGKGISAALLMANFQASLRAWVTVEPELTNIIDRLNDIVLKNTKGEKFITLFLARYNQQTRKLNYINAGHNPSIMFCDGEAVPLKLGTTMIGAFDDLPFLNEGEVDVEPNTLIFNYTDGLMDHEPDVSKQWNDDKLVNCVIKNGKLPPIDFNQAILDHLNKAIKAKPIDDITLLTLKIF